MSEFRNLFELGFLAFIGFTMSLFNTSLAFTTRYRQNSASSLPPLSAF
ncbi:Na+/H+ antiporter NhaA [Chryseobacterium sp. Leaf201]|nr:Na+/H+ antiporter NhaA [Chryseobacterium sp. Leaf201]